MFYHVLSNVDDLVFDSLPCLLSFRQILLCARRFSVSPDSRQRSRFAAAISDLLGNSGYERGVSAHS